MKIVSAEHERAHQDATVMGGIKGAAISAGLLVPFHYGMRRYSSTYRTLPLPLKAAGMVTISVFTINFLGEKAGEAYDQSQWSGAGARSIDAKSKAREKRWEELGTMDKATDFVKRWKFPMIVGSWAGVLGGSYLLISRNKAMTVPQRLVQARIYAQAWTVVCLIAAIASTQIGDDDTSGTHHHHTEDHSWRDIVAQTEAAAKLEDERRSQETDPTAVLRYKKAPSPSGTR